jgi:hypothetical protein
LSSKLRTIDISTSLRWYQGVRFRGDFKKILAEDYPVEGTGTVAVTLCGNMAMQGIVPRRKKDGIIIREYTIASMHPDDDHDTPWLAIQIDAYVHSSCILPMGIPRDLETGYVSVLDIELMSKD